MMKRGGIWDFEFRNADLEREAFLKLVSMRKTKHVEDWEAVAKLKESLATKAPRLHDTKSKAGRCPSYSWLCAFVVNVICIYSGLSGCFGEHH